VPKAGRCRHAQQLAARPATTAQPVGFGPAGALVCWWAQHARGYNPASQRPWPSRHGARGHCLNVHGMAWHDGAGRDGDALANTRHAEADDRVNTFDGDGHGSPRVEPGQRAMGGVE
jgi:hypothetical protein